MIHQLCLSQKAVHGRFGIGNWDTAKFSFIKDRQPILVPIKTFAGVRFLPNFYDDNITVAGYEMVGVTHPDALSYYDFKLIETTQIDGDPVYVIDVDTCQTPSATLCRNRLCTW